MFSFIWIQHFNSMKDILVFFQIIRNKIAGSQKHRNDRFIVCYRKKTEFRARTF